MNEQIKLLAEQAGLVRGGYANGTNIMTWRESFDNPGSLEKFAELIVKECVKVCADRGTHHDGLYSAWADDCSKRIGKHFGVEE
jgi:hypothetical protein